uniref:Uncharacterized protein n=1 Tax=Oryza meridionalis TaxID=40149 RepID=A0A0E0FBJ2_9ORYZ
MPPSAFASPPPIHHLLPPIPHSAERSFSHRPGREASQQNIEEENSDDVEIEDDLIEKRRKREGTKLKRPPNGQEIPIRPNGDE